MGCAGFFVRRKTRKKEKGMQPDTHSAPGPSHFVLFFLPDNPLARNFANHTPLQPKTAGTHQ
jgi:hypothetical protein